MWVVLYSNPSYPNLIVNLHITAVVLVVRQTINLFACISCWLQCIFKILIVLKCSKKNNFFWPSLYYSIWSFCVTTTRSVSCCLCCQLTLPVWWRLRSFRDWRDLILARLKTQTIFTTFMSRDILMSGMKHHLYNQAVVYFCKARMWHTLYEGSTGIVVQMFIHSLSCVPVCNIQKMIFPPSLVYSMLILWASHGWPVTAHLESWCTC